jgi:HEAT repeat protein
VFTPVDQFLVDKDTDLVAEVTVKDVETRWIILEDGDHVPVNMLTCLMEEPLRGARDWPRNETRSTVQFSYTELIQEPISPPAVLGKRYLLWASTNDPNNSELGMLGSTLLAHPQGLHLVRGEGKERYFFWDGKAYSIDEVRRAVKSGGRIRLDTIIDPVKRLEIARGRIAKGDVGDISSFVNGLMLGIRDPVGQAGKVAKPEGTEPGEELSSMFHMNSKSGFQIWYESLALLQVLGEKPVYRDAVVSALKPLVGDPRERVRLCAALVLARLGDASGKRVLERALSADTVALNKDPESQLMLPGRLEYDDNSVVAAAYGLGLLGDRSGLRLESMEARLAAAEGLAAHPDDAFRKDLQGMAAQLDKEVEKLSSSGQLGKTRDKGDFTERYPKEWVKAHVLLARMGDDTSLRRLVEAYKTDLATYPVEEESPFPNPKIVQWTSLPRGWVSLPRAVASADAKQSRLLERLRILLAHDPVWQHPAVLVLRLSLGDPSAKIVEHKTINRKQDVREKVAGMIASSVPAVRAQGLAGAGFNRMDEYYPTVLEAALRGKGVEKKAAIYGLGFYGKRIPEDALHRLVREGGLETRLSGLEIATRHEPAPFAGDAMQLLRDMAVQGNSSTDASQEEFDRTSLLRHMTRILARFSRSDIPRVILDGLRSPEPAIRLHVALALGMGGNPAAVPVLTGVREDPEMMVRAAVIRALAVLGPVE